MVISPADGGKNIVVFSDGTGQRGGILFDERRSNIYKVYRACRCGPDSAVDPAQQLSFYDPGIGTVPLGSGPWAILRRIYNVVSQAFGLGLTKNIVDCYAAIIRMWRPGDRIFLFGFSRGAYTIRCLAAVIALCGVPTRMKDGSSLRLDEKSTTAIAREAVKTVYQHTSSWDPQHATSEQRIFLEQRQFLGRQFQELYGSGDADRANVYPYFIGVFDTVASLSNPEAVVILTGALVVLAAILAAILGFFFGASGLLGLGAAILLVVAVAVAVSIHQRIKWEIGLQPRRAAKLFHLAEARVNFYDTTLNAHVGYARHALSIDEERTSFQRVRWAAQSAPTATREGEPDWLEQIWFAGDHSDIGGSYDENESRLSDITLKWMSDAAIRVGLITDPTVLQAHPDALGPQHDETQKFPFNIAGKASRNVPTDAPLHPTVLKRFAAPSVLQYNIRRPYRPEALRNHQQVSSWYSV